MRLLQALSALLFRLRFLLELLQNILARITTEINGNIHSVTTLVIFAVAPLNLLKGASVSVITMLVYKQLSPILKAGAGKKKI